MIEEPGTQVPERADTDTALNTPISAIEALEARLFDSLTATAEVLGTSNEHSRRSGIEAAREVKHGAEAHLRASNGTHPSTIYVVTTPSCFQMRLVWEVM